MVEAFKRLINEKILDESWELHLVGGVGVGWEHGEYLRNLQKESEGYPVVFHAFASFDKLKKLYSQAKIYWHATGFEANKKTEPIVFEHFGISVVEAMSAGCVPIVFRGGGLTESVKGDIGFLWSTIEEMVEKTKLVADDDMLFRKLSKNANIEAQKYSRERFSKELLKIIKDLI
jgi:glycosyltransferase involved in cell wall biosynthesis